jgi:hypothetical protein
MDDGPVDEAVRALNEEEPLRSKQQNLASSEQVGEAEMKAGQLVSRSSFFVQKPDEL